MLARLVIFEDATPQDEAEFLASDKIRTPIFRVTQNGTVVFEGAEAA